MRATAFSALCLVACGGGAVPVATSHPTSPPPSAPAAGTTPPLADDATWDRWRNADVAILASQRFHDPLSPLVHLRESQGHVVALLDIEPLYARFSKGTPDAAALLTAIRQLSAHTAGKLRFVLLVGDAGGWHDAPSPSEPPIPTFYMQKGKYEHHTPKEHQSAHAIPPEEHDAYPSDDPYATLTDNPPADAKRLAVGRVPARTADDVSGFVQKILAYETTPLSGDQLWRRRVTIYASAAHFGELADSVAESLASTILDQDLSYDYDLRFTFAKDDSPYAYRFDKIEQKLVSDLDDGAVVAAYVGHGAVTSFAEAEMRGYGYEVGTSDDAAALRIGAGKPVFFSLACDTGAFDRPDGLRSIAEAMVLNSNGPVAVFASSRESHPYPNALYGEGIIQHFINGHEPTVGEGILAMKDSMVKGTIPIAELLLGDDIGMLKREHVGLYNLFGDPATRLRYVQSLTITSPPGTVVPGATFAVDVSASSVAEGQLVATVETHRGVLKGAIVGVNALQQMSVDDAFVAMAKNNALANDKVVFTANGAIHGGKAHVELKAPDDGGDYVVKVMASGGDAAAAGHVDLHVAGR
jgi:hypothetical protein